MSRFLLVIVSVLLGATLVAGEPEREYSVYLEEHETTCSLRLMSPPEMLNLIGDFGTTKLDIWVDNFFWASSLILDLLGVVVDPLHHAPWVVFNGVDLENSKGGFLRRCVRLSRKACKRYKAISVNIENRSDEAIHLKPSEYLGDLHQFVLPKNNLLHLYRDYNFSRIGISLGEVLSVGIGGLCTLVSGISAAVAYARTGEWPRGVGSVAAISGATTLLAGGLLRNEHRRQHAVDDHKKELERYTRLAVNAGESERVRRFSPDAEMYVIPPGARFCDLFFVKKENVDDLLQCLGSPEEHRDKYS